jgi:hypothetical protein
MAAPLQTTSVATATLPHPVPAGAMVPVSVWQQLPLVQQSGLALNWQVPLGTSHVLVKHEPATVQSLSALQQPALATPTQVPCAEHESADVQAEPSEQALPTKGLQPTGSSSGTQAKQALVPAVPDGMHWPSMAHCPTMTECLH